MTGGRNDQSRHRAPRGPRKRARKVGERERRRQRRRRKRRRP